MTDASRPDIDRLTDFVKGRLTPGENLEVLDWVEKDQGVSEDLELVLELENIPPEEWERIRKEGPRPNHPGRGMTHR